MRLINAWALTRYRDADAVLRDHKRFGNARRILIETIPLSLLDMDPPEHTRLRALVGKAFTPKAVAMLRPHIEEITRSLLLALLEARIAFAALLDRYPSIRLAAESRHRPAVVIRGVQQLWIEVRRTVSGSRQ